MKRLITLFYAVCAIFLCANFSTNKSVDGEDRPPINYTGTLTAIDGNKNMIDNITISGLYKSIPLYGVPSQPNEKPTLNTTYINLDAVENIQPISKNPHESIKKFDNRDYVELIITLKSVPAAPTSQQHFLVETTRRVYCDVVGVGGIVNLKKEIAFEAISDLTITGFKARSRQTCQEPAKDKKTEEDSAAKKALCAQAKRDLKELETSAKKDPKTRNLIKNTQDTVNYICMDKNI